MNALTPADTPANLQALRELPLPAPVSYAPQTIGWLFVVIVLLALLAVGAWLAWRRRQRTRYRREALRELARIEAKLGHDTNALADIAPLLKRTAMAAATRDQVASLSGASWLAYLQRTHEGFDEPSGAALYAASYAPQARAKRLSPRQTRRLLRAARDWIEHHHVEV
jgi:hypothetical protein